VIQPLVEPVLFIISFELLHINWIVVASVTPLFDNMSFHFISTYNCIYFGVFCTTHILACGYWHPVCAVPLCRPAGACY